MEFSDATYDLIFSLSRQADRSNLIDDDVTVPAGVQVSGLTQTAIVAATDLSVEVTNGYLWPVGGTVRIDDGTNSEVLTIRRVTDPTGRGSAGMPDSRGVVPNGILTFTTDTVSAYAAGTQIWLDTNAPSSASAFDGGLVGTHDIAAVMRAMLRDAAGGSITVSGAGTTTSLVDAGAFPNFATGALIGAEVTFTSGALNGTTVTVLTQPDANTLTFATQGSAPGGGATYTIRFPLLDSILATLDAALPANVTEAGVRGTADISPTPDALGTTIINGLAQLIEHFNGTLPTELTDGATLGSLAHDVPVRSVVTAPAAALATELAVEDASLFAVDDTVYTVNALTGAVTNTDTVTAVRTGKGGQGPNIITITALAAPVAIPSIVVVDKATGTVERGRRKRAPLFPMGSKVVARWLDLAATAMEDNFTIPV